MWLINWIGLTISNIMMAYGMFSIGELLGYIMAGIFIINTGVVLWMWHTWPEETYKDTSNKFSRKTPTVMKHNYSKRKYY